MLRGKRRTGSGEVDDPTGRVAEVVWEDSHSKHGWGKDVMGLPVQGVMKTVGYVLQDNEHGVVLVESWDGTDIDGEALVSSRYGCQTGIPRSAILKMKYLRGH